jgi:hypothetical protein
MKGINSYLSNRGITDKLRIYQVIYGTVPPYASQVLIYQMVMVALSERTVPRILVCQVTACYDFHHGSIRKTLRYLNVV